MVAFPSMLLRTMAAAAWAPVFEFGRVSPSMVPRKPEMVGVNGMVKMVMSVPERTAESRTVCARCGGRPAMIQVEGPRPRVFGAVAGGPTWKKVGSTLM